jgi:putative ABC transport system permease protein
VDLVGFDVGDKIGVLTLQPRQTFTLVGIFGYMGLLRAVGMPRSQVTQMVAVESVVIATFGPLLGVLVGSALGAAVVRAVPDELVSVLSLPWGPIAVFLALAVIVGLVAAAIPAVKAARTDVLRAIAYE